MIVTCSRLFLCDLFRARLLFRVHTATWAAQRFQLDRHSHHDAICRDECRYKPSVQYHREETTLRFLMYRSVLVGGGGGCAYLTVVAG